MLSDVSSMDLKKGLSIDLLISGSPSAYVDFFYIAHPTGDKPSSEEGPAKPELELSHDDLNLLADYLNQADKYHRNGDTEGVYESYRKIAQYMDERGDLKRCTYFYQKCLHIASTAGWPAGEMEANLNLGLLAERLDLPLEAMGFHECHVDLSAKYGSPADHLTGAKNLVRAYSLVADLAYADRRLTDAEGVLMKMQRTAKEHKLSKAWVDSMLRLGKVALLDGRHADALGMLKEFLLAAEKIKDTRAQGQGYYLLALTMEKLDKLEESARCLEEYRRLAMIPVIEVTEDGLGGAVAKAAGAAPAGSATEALEAAPDAAAAAVPESAAEPARTSQGVEIMVEEEEALSASTATLESSDMVHVKETKPVVVGKKPEQSDDIDKDGFALASCKLGETCFRQGNYDAAAHYFEDFFETSLKLGNVGTTNAARVNLGLSRAMQKRIDFMKKLDVDFGGLLDYKIARTDME